MWKLEKADIEKGAETAAAAITETDDARALTVTREDKVQRLRVRLGIILGRVA